jgi:hypothetical protein
VLSLKPAKFESLTVSKRRDGVLHRCTGSRADGFLEVIKLTLRIEVESDRRMAIPTLALLSHKLIQRSLFVPESRR